MKADIILPAAGQGRRMGSEINKQYLSLLGKPVLAHTITSCLASEAFENIIVVVTPGEEEIFHRDVLLPWFSGQRITVVTGGRERQDSVRNALGVVGTDADFICVHDGARPLVRPELFLRCLKAASVHGAAIAAVLVKDTIKVVHSDGKVETTPLRHTLRSVQTPQVFRRDLLDTVYKRAHEDGFYATDDAALLEHYGYPVYVVDGDYENIKVTTPDDLVLADAFLGRRANADRNRL
ncbi:MAG: 2-C-methyl-D-erythritol 4-phosphate cytidylyltransferase [Bacillota bacterium]|nr:2-C-methyl-D-erythritol 4-phosphate cytidylyltransferase [Bacillota bacterium]MDW7683774.1 2-C-methyl-D-erythritol 4-phosphate cytidylyltransferase [Bacillota bacterium]